MLDPRWLLRAKAWAANPPSARSVALVLGLLAALLALAAVERVFGWPEALTVEPARGGSPIR